MKKLVTLVMLVCLMAALVGGATLAWFTDSSQFGSASISSGTLRIDAVRDNGEWKPGPIFYTTVDEGIVPSGPDEGKPGKYPTGLWIPGMTKTRNITVTSTGSLDAKISRIGAALDGDAVFLADSEAVNQFSQYMQVKVFIIGTDEEGAVVQTVLLDSTPLSDLLSANGKECTFMKDIGKNGSSQDVYFTCTLNKEAGNPLQGKKPIVSFYLIAEQV